MSQDPFEATSSGLLTKTMFVSWCATSNDTSRSKIGLVVENLLIFTI